MREGHYQSTESTQNEGMKMSLQCAFVWGGHLSDLSRHNFVHIILQMKFSDTNRTPRASRPSHSRLRLAANQSRQQRGFAPAARWEGGRVDVWTDGRTESGLGRLRREERRGEGGREAGIDRKREMIGFPDDGISCDPRI